MGRRAGRKPLREFGGSDCRRLDRRSRFLLLGSPTRTTSLVRVRCWRDPHLRHHADIRASLCRYVAALAALEEDEALIAAGGVGGVGEGVAGGGWVITSEMAVRVESSSRVRSP